MAIVGFSFTKISAEKKVPVRGRVNINNNMVVLGAEDANITMATDKKGVRIRFLAESKYEPDIGHIFLEGEVILLEDAKVAEEILQRWSKEHALPTEIMGTVLNHILDHTNVQALILARDMNLPAPVPLPKANLQVIPRPATAPAAEEPKADKPKGKKK